MHRPGRPKRGTSHSPEAGNARNEESTRGHGADSVSALTSYYDAHSDDLKRYALAIVNDLGLAEDAVQQTFANTIAAVERGTEITNIEAWLKRCVRNLAVDRLRVDACDPLEEGLEIDSPMIGCAELADLRDRWRTVEQAVETLSPNQREALLLAELRGLEYKEISVIMNMSVDSVGQLLYRARQRVRSFAHDRCGPLAGVLLSAHRGSPGGASIDGLRVRLANSINTLYRWLAMLTGRSGEALAAPVTALMLAALVVSAQIGLWASSPDTGQPLASPPPPAALPVGASSTEQMSSLKSSVLPRPAPPSGPGGDRESHEPPSPSSPSQPGRQRDGSDSQSSGGNAGAAGAARAQEDTSSQSATGESGGGAADTDAWVSLGTGGSLPDDGSMQPAISAVDELIAFTSVASNLVDGDSNGAADVFVNNFAESRTWLVSKGPNGQPADGPSGYPAISSAGDVVAFTSEATNLVAGDHNGAADVFVRDGKSHAIERVSVGDAGTEGDAGSGDPALSADGRFVTFTSKAGNLVEEGRLPVPPPADSSADAKSGSKPASSATEQSQKPEQDANEFSDIFVYDRETDELEQITLASSGKEPNGDSMGSSISADGRFVAFTSEASNLVAGDDNGVADVFLYDRLKNNIERVSVASNGGEANGESREPALSSSGRYIAFTSAASNLAPGDKKASLDVYVHNRFTGVTALVSDPGVALASEPSAAISRKPQISADGHFIAFEYVAAPPASPGPNGVPQSEVSRVVVRDTVEDRILPATDGTSIEDAPWSTREPTIDPTGSRLAYVVDIEREVAGSTDRRGVIFAQELGW